MSTLWIFGPSLTLPWQLSDANKGWPALVHTGLSFGRTQHFGAAAADNFFIYHSFIEQLPNFRPNDLVVVGWSHPNRKMFVLDRHNPAHVAALTYSIHYQQGSIEFIRSKNPVTDIGSKWALMKPKDSGLQFYDTWFRHYFSEHEQKCNFQAYYDSVHSRASCQCISLFFSKESVTDLMITPTLFYLDFVHEHQVNISHEDYHLNEKGHELFAHEIMRLIERQRLDLEPDGKSTT